MGRLWSSFLGARTRVLLAEGVEVEFVMLASPNDRLADHRIDGLATTINHFVFHWTDEMEMTAPAIGSWLGDPDVLANTLTDIKLLGKEENRHCMKQTLPETLNFSANHWGHIEGNAGHIKPEAMLADRFLE